MTRFQATRRTVITEIYLHAAGELLLVQQQFGICVTRALIEDFEVTLVILEICHVTGGTKFFSIKAMHVTYND